MRGEVFALRAVLCTKAPLFILDNGQGYLPFPANRAKGNQRKTCLLIRLENSSTLGHRSIIIIDLCPIDFFFSWGSTIRQCDDCYM